MGEQVKSSVVVKKVKLGSQGMEVSQQGLGCSRLPTPSNSLLNHAVKLGVTLFDSSDVYGPSETLISQAIKEEGLREKVQISTKFGCRFLDGKPCVQGDPTYVRVACEASLKKLGVDCIDLYYQHRIDTSVPIEITIGELKKLVEEGKIKYIGLSEASASTIRRAHAIHPITAVQLEWSLWARDAEEEIIPTCRELGIGIVAYSPLGRGFFSLGPKVVETFGEKDMRKSVPRFQAENLEKNKEVFERVREMAARKGCSTAQLALAWVHHQGNDVVPIPGTTKINNLNQNVAALSITLTPQEIEELESFASHDKVKGERIQGTVFTWRDSDTPPLSSWDIQAQ